MKLIFSLSIRTHNNIVKEVIDGDNKLFVLSPDNFKLSKEKTLPPMTPSAAAEPN